MRTQPSDIQAGSTAPIAGTIIVLIIFSVFVANAVFAQEQDQEESPSTPIHITADRLISDSTSDHAEFIGKVKVVQGETTIHSDRLKLYYADKQTDQNAMGAGNIETIEATGHVRIDFDNRVAVGAKAVYSTKERKLVLTGPGAQITEGPDKVEGDIITFYRQDGRIDINGGVKMQIRSNQRGLN